MKNTLFAFLLCTFSFLGWSRAQDKPCSAKRFMFTMIIADPSSSIGCDFDDVIATDPWDSFVDDQLMWHLGSTVTFCTPHDLDHDGHGCVDGNALKQCIEDAWHEWANLCPGALTISEEDVATAGCCIDITYGIKADQFDTRIDPIDRIGAQTTVHVNSPANWIVCQVPPTDFDAGKIQILINQTGKLAGWHAYPCDPAPAGCNALYKDNLCNVLRHEIGHCFGLTHLEDLDANGDYAIDLGTGLPSSDGLKTDLMAHLAFTDWTKACGLTPMSRNDICAFKKLYCRESLAVQSQPSTFERTIQLSPNPANKTVQVLLTLEAAEAGVLHIYSITGKEIHGIGRRVRGGENGFALDVSSLTPGAYVVSLEGAFHRVSRLLRIKK